MPSQQKKLKCAEYTKGCFHGGLNTIELATYKDKIIITQLLQKHVVKWYHTYQLHPGLDRTDAMIHQNLYWLGIREAAQK